MIGRKIRRKNSKTIYEIEGELDFENCGGKCFLLKNLKGFSSKESLEEYDTSDVNMFNYCMYLISRGYIIRDSTIKKDFIFVDFDEHGKR